MADEANRFLTAYLYENMALEGPHREGVIFTDSGYGDIQWMSGGTHTPFHGSFVENTYGVALAFDALYHHGRHAQPDLKKAILFRTTGCQEWSYVGHDYAHRFVRMKPLSRWIYDRVLPNWNLHLRWNDGHWEPVNSDGSPAAAPPAAAPGAPLGDPELHEFNVVPPVGA